MKVNETNVTVQATENPDVKKFSLSKKTLKKIVKYKSKNKRKPYPVFSEVGTHLVCQIMEINGVREICVNSHNLQIVKETETDWLKLENGICKAMINCFNND
jgi:hypothetical protein